MKKLAVLLILLVAPVLLAACGDSEGTAAQSDGQAFREEHPGSAEYGSPPLEFEADPGGDLAYTTDEVTADAGNVTIEFTNPQSTPHNVAIEVVGDGVAVETEVVGSGFAATTITLNKKRKFVFFCAVPGHRKAGMEGTINVE